VPCAAAPVERHVTVRGHLTGPSDELRDGVDGTLYAHGNGYGEFFFRWTGDPEYDFVDDMADRGHVSVTIDRLGYGDSDKPDGNEICFGTEADVLHQIVQQLRDGSYHGGDTPSFGRVALVGHSASGLIAEQEAAGFHDVDALGVLSSGAATASPLVLQRTGEAQLRCLTAGDGYAGLEGSAAQFRADHLYNIDRAIADEVTERRTEDACGGTRNAGQAVGANPVRNNTITVPVLLLVGKDDKFFAMNPAAQAATYSQSRKVTLVELADTGHALAFGRTAPRFRDEVHGWLDANGF
jgi:pimeloyl-ACP methyl ester carboxylesterase